MLDAEHLYQVANNAIGSLHVYSWNVYFAQNLNAVSGGSFTQEPASPVIHHGGVCESGIACYPVPQVTALGRSVRSGFSVLLGSRDEDLEPNKE